MNMIIKINFFLNRTNLNSVLLNRKKYTSINIHTAYISFSWTYITNSTTKVLASMYFFTLREFQIFFACPLAEHLLLFLSNFSWSLCLRCKSCNSKIVFSKLASTWTLINHRWTSPILRFSRNLFPQNLKSAFQFNLHVSILGTITRRLDELWVLLKGQGGKDILVFWQK